MEELPNHCCCCIMQFCLHRCSWRKGIWSSLLLVPSCPDLLPFALPCQWPAVGVHSALTHRAASAESKAHWSFPGTTRDTYGNKERIPSYSIHWNLPFLLPLLHACWMFFTILMHKYRGKGRWPNVHKISHILRKHFMSYSYPQAAIGKAKIEFRFKALSVIEHSATLIQADLAWEVYMWKRHHSPSMREHSNPISIISQK